MRRRIHVSTPLTDMSENFRKKSVTHHAGLLFVLRCSLGKPDQRPEFLARSHMLDRRTFCWLEPFVDRCERFLKLARPRAVGPGQIPLPKMITAEQSTLERSLHIDAVNRLRKRKRTTSNNSKQKTLLLLRLADSSRSCQACSHRLNLNYVRNHGRERQVIGDMKVKILFE